MRTAITAVVVASLFASASTATEPEGTPMDALLETSAGSNTHLATLYGKPTVLFYEDRDSTKLNQHVKDALFAAGRDRGLLHTVTVIAVANVASYNWFPARNFVLAAVRDVEQQVHLPVYLDFAGSMSAAPWSLPATSSTVVLLDATGVARARFSGKMSDAQVKELFAALEGLTR